MSDWVITGTGSNFSGTQVSCSLEGVFSRTSGSILFAHAKFENGPGASSVGVTVSPTGWQQAGNALYEPGGTDIDSIVYYRLATNDINDDFALEIDTSVSWNVNITNAYHPSGIHVDVFDVTPGASYEITGQNSNTPVAPAITTLTNDVVVFHFTAIALSNTDSTSVSSDLSGSIIASELNHNADRDIDACIFAYVKSVAGSIPATTITYTDGNVGCEWVAHTIAIKAATPGEVPAGENTLINLTDNIIINNILVNNGLVRV